MRALWEEFEEEATPEAKFGAALDRFMPTLLNFYTEGRSWQENGITFSQVMARNERAVKAGAPALWEVAKGLFEEAVSLGYLKPQ